MFLQIKSFLGSKEGNPLLHIKVRLKTIKFLTALAKTYTLPQKGWITRNLVRLCRARLSAHFFID